MVSYLHKSKLTFSKTFECSMLTATEKDMLSKHTQFELVLAFSRSVLWQSAWHGIFCKPPQVLGDVVAPRFRGVRDVRVLPTANRRGPARRHSTTTAIIRECSDVVSLAVLCGSRYCIDIADIDGVPALCCLPAIGLCQKAEQIVHIVDAPSPEPPIVKQVQQSTCAHQLRY